MIMSQTNPRKPVLASLAGGILNGLIGIVRVVRTQRQLAELDRLDDRQLADIGLDRSDVREARLLRWRDDPTGLLSGARSQRAGRAR